MDVFEPYFFFRIFLILLFSGYLFYAVLDIVFWYQSLPPLFKKYALLSLVSLRFSAVKKELFMISLLSPVLLLTFLMNLKVIF
jgi:hypothetical protein